MVDKKVWTASDVERLLCNPIYAGVHPYPAIVGDEEWIKAGVNVIKEMGARRFLRTMLAELKASMRASGESDE